MELISGSRLLKFCLTQFCIEADLQTRMLMSSAKIVTSEMLVHIAPLTQTWNLDGKESLLWDSNVEFLSKNQLSSKVGIFLRRFQNQPHWLVSTPEWLNVLIERLIDSNWCLRKELTFIIISKTAWRKENSTKHQREFKKLKECMKTWSKNTRVKMSCS